MTTPTPTTYKGLTILEGAVGPAGEALTQNFKTIADDIETTETDVSTLQDDVDNLETILEPASSLTVDRMDVLQAGGPLASATTCKAVWVGAPMNEAGVAFNTLPVFIGESTAKALGAQGAIPIMPNNYDGFVIAIDDPSKVYVRANDGNQDLAYRILI